MSDSNTPEGPIMIENWRGEDGEMRKWVLFSIAGEDDAYAPLLRVVEFADRMFEIAIDPQNNRQR